MGQVKYLIERLYIRTGLTPRRPVAWSIARRQEGVRTPLHHWTRSVVAGVRSQQCVYEWTLAF